MMNASENLNAAGILVEKRPENGNVHASSIMQPCRSAMDSSARTIWLLSDPDSEVRRDRCLSLPMEQLEQQRRFLKINDDNVNRGPNPPPADCGRSSVQESCLTRCPLLRTGRASAATGSMCEVTGCAIPTGSNEPLYGRTNTKSPMVHSSMVHVAGGEEGSTRHDDEMPGPAPRVDLAQSTALKASIFKPWKEGGADRPGAVGL